MSKFGNMVRDAAIISLVIFSVGIFSVTGYMIVWTIIFANMIEAPLPESEEEVPDLGIINNTDAENENEQ